MGSGVWGRPQPNPSSITKNNLFEVVIVGIRYNIPVIFMDDMYGFTEVGT